MLGSFDHRHSSSPSKSIRRLAELSTDCAPVQNTSATFLKVRRSPRKLLSEFEQVEIVFVFEGLLADVMLFPMMKVA